MTRSNIRARSLAGLGAGALAAAALTLSAPPAGAAPDQTDHVSSNGNTRLTMSVSDTTPKVGDTLTFTAKFDRKWSVENYTKVKQLVPSCLTYVDGSAKWQGTPIASVDDHKSTGAGDQAYVLLSAPSGIAWSAPGIGGSWGEKRGATMQFVVTKACATGEALPTSVHYDGSLTKEYPQNAGPTITVAKQSGGDNNGGGSNGGGNNGGDNGGNNNGGNNNGGGSSGGSGDSSSGNDTAGGNDTGGSHDNSSDGSGGSNNKGSVGSHGSVDLGSLASLF